jgi:hypothetical protein
LLKLEILPSHLRPRLQELLDLHYRLRFDPSGLLAADRARLRDETKRWLTDFRQCLVPSRVEK